MNYTVRWLPPSEAKLRWMRARAFLKESIAELADIISRLPRDRPFDLASRASVPASASGFIVRCAFAF